jgi:glycosyltransferase involved in cell wall biosynthesis
MRILAITNLYPNVRQPHRAPYNRQHFKQFAVSHAVRVIAPIAWTDKLSGWRNALPPLPKDRRACCDGIKVDHPCYWYTPKLLRNQYGRFYLMSVRKTFERIASDFQPDVVFASWAHPDGWAAVRLGHAVGLPVVVNVVGSDVLCMGAARQHLIAETVRAADGVVAASQDLARRVVQLGANPKRVQAIHNGVDTHLFGPGNRPAARQRLRWPADMPQLLFVGNLVPVKGLDVLIDALARLKREQIPFHCHLVGQGPLRQALQRQADAAGVADRLTFVGPVPHDQLPDWFRAADLFVLPSRSEGVPNVLLEAAACGTPFVASNVGGIPEIAHLGRSRLMPADDIPALVAAIRGSLTHDVIVGCIPPHGIRSHEAAAGEILTFVEQIIYERSSCVTLI